VLKYAASLWGEDPYCLSDDCTFYFNQFRLNPSEWHKSCFQWLSLAADGTPVPGWIMEYALGFGHAASSGIAQHFSHAVLWLLRQRVNAEETPILAADTDPARRAYLDERATLGTDQATLWTADIFTDDGAMLIIGADRVARILAHWGRLLEQIGIVTAGPHKRIAGCTIRWLGVYLNTFLGNQVIPRDKAIKASTVLGDLAAGCPVEFRDYRSLMGRVKHFRGIVEDNRTSTYHVYTPFAAGKANPRGRVIPTVEITSKADEWRQLLLRRPGRTCARFAPDATSAAPFILADVWRAFHVFTYAALLGAPVPGLGGYLTGQYFSFALPEDMLGYPTPQLEYLAIIAATIVLRDVCGALAVLVTDSITCQLVICNNSAHAGGMMRLHRELLSAIGGRPVFAETRHGNGETNPCADLASRGRLDTGNRARCSRPVVAVAGEPGRRRQALALVSRLKCKGALAGSVATSRWPQMLLGERRRYGAGLLVPSTIAGQLPASLFLFLFLTPPLSLSLSVLAFQPFSPPCAVPSLFTVRSSLLLLLHGAFYFLNYVRNHRAC